MKRVLITGTSGTGKSAVARELAARGHQAIDLDTPEWSEWIVVDPADTLAPGDGKDWVWREERVRALLLSHHRGSLFICGCAENMGRLFPWIDTVILLSAPSQGCWKLGIILSLMDLLPERRSFAGLRRLCGVAFPDPAWSMSRHRVRGVCRRHAATALAAPVWQTGCAMAVMNKASTRPEEYAIDIGITTSERIDVIIRAGRDPAPTAG